MRSNVLVLSIMLASALLSCKRGSQKLEGHWRGQRADGVVDGLQVAATTFALGTEIIAQGDQIAIQTPASKAPSAKYVVDKEDATTVVIHTERDGTAETFSFVGGTDTMVWRIDQQRSITFKRIP